MRIKSFIFTLALLCAAIASAQNPDAGKVQVGTVIQASGPATPIRLTPTNNTVPIFNGTTLVNSTALGTAAYVGFTEGVIGTLPYFQNDGTGEPMIVINEQVGGAFWRFRVPGSNGTHDIYLDKLENPAQLAGNTFTAGQVIAPASAATALTLTGGTVTTSNPLISGTQTWNAGAVQFQGVTLAYTKTAAANNSSFFKITQSGSSGDALNLFYASPYTILRLGGTDGSANVVELSSRFGAFYITPNNGANVFINSDNTDLRAVSNNAATVYYVLGSDGAANILRLGAESATPSAQTLKGPDTSTNGNAGAALSIQGGNGLTTGAGGALNLDGGDSPSGTDGNIVIGGTRGNVVIGPSGTAFNKSAVYTYALTETVEAQTVETITVTATGVADGDKVAVEIPDPGDGVCVQSIDCQADAIVLKYFNANTVTNRTLSGTLRFRTFEE